MARSQLAYILVLNLVVHAFCLPADLRLRRGAANNEVELEDSDDGGVDEIKINNAPSNPAATLPPAPASSYEDRIKEIQQASPSSTDDDDDDFDFEPMTTSQSGGGSNIFSLLNLATNLFPGSSSGNRIMRNILRNFVYQYGTGLLQAGIAGPIILRRADNVKNVITIDTELKPPVLAKQEIEESESSQDTSEDDESNSDDDNEVDGNDSNDSNDSNTSNDAKESVESHEDSRQEGEANGNGDVNGDRDDDNGDNSSEFDDDEPPEGDGMGGGILGLLAGLSGGEDGSDLGTLLATISGIVGNLSGDGVDINALIASGIGLFVGLLSEGDQNPGEILASYLLTSLDTLSGGGSQNNGQFFGKFISKLIRGTSAYRDPNAESEEEGNETKDSAGFLLALISGLLGDMSKGSSSSSPHR